MVVGLLVVLATNNGTMTVQPGKLAPETMGGRGVVDVGEKWRP